MEVAILNTMDILETAGHLSKGNQLKWRQGNIWYKADHIGYGGLAEIVVSHPLRHTSVENFVHYGPVRIQYAGQEYLGCQSRNFLLPDEELITIDWLFRPYTGWSITREMGHMTSVRGWIVYLVKDVIDFTGLETFGQHLMAVLELDAFFLGGDRYTNNITVFRNAGEDKYQLCPYFDHGLSLYPDTTTDFKMKRSLVECRKIVEAKPLSRGFDRQMDEAKTVCGKQLSSHFDSKVIRRELAALEGIYEGPVIRRVEEALNQQGCKYEYLFS